MTDRTPGRAIQRHLVGVSVEALASAWSRRDHVPGGSVVVVDTEIAARRRLGEPWSERPDDTLSFAMVLRPDIELTHHGLLWLVGTLAAAEAGAACGRVDLAIRWPDSVATIDTADPVAFVNIVTQLGPGHIEHAIVALRFLLPALGLESGDRAELLDRAVVELDRAAALLVTDRQSLIDAVTELTSIIGTRVKAALLPRGEARGRATAIDPEGRLVLETSTGMLEYVTVDSIRAINPA